MKSVPIVALTAALLSPALAQEDNQKPDSLASVLAAIDWVVLGKEGGARAFFASVDQGGISILDVCNEHCGGRGGNKTPPHYSRVALDGLTIIVEKWDYEAHKVKGLVSRVGGQNFINWFTENKPERIITTWRQECVTRP